MNTRKRRKHNSLWADNTVKERSADRRQRLNEIAHLIGYGSWRKLETAALKGEVEVTQKNPTAIIL